MKEHSSEDGDKMEDSPVMGLLTGPRKNEQETEESEGKENKVPDETMVKKALWRRASYIKANSEYDLSLLLIYSCPQNAV